MHLSTVNLPLLYIYVFVCSSVHGFVQTNDLVINEGATQEVITMTLDVKGNTFREPASTRVFNFGFSFMCIYSSNRSSPLAVGESCWTTTFRHRVINCTQACLPHSGFLAFQFASCSIYSCMISLQATNSI